MVRRACGVCFGQAHATDSHAQDEEQGEPVIADSAAAANGWSTVRPSTPHVTTQTRTPTPRGATFPWAAVRHDS